MFKNRINYWSCSKLANLIRGSEKPCALTFEEWEKWRHEIKSKSPIRYWIAEKLLNKIQDFFNFPRDIYNNVRYYLRNRFITKTHYLKTGLKPGVYHEIDERILYGLFNELVDFVEIEQAWMQSISSDKKKYKFKKGRCAEAGLDYLKWSMSLNFNEEYGVNKDEEGYGELTPQAKCAAKILELYNWWKDRKYRPDPMEESGWNKYYKNKIENKGDEEGRIALEKLDKLEEKYEKEDEDMLIELIKIRKSLWT